MRALPTLLAAATLFGAKPGAADDSEKPRFELPEGFDADALPVIGEEPVLFVHPMTRELKVDEAALIALPEEEQARALRSALQVLFDGVGECFEEAGEVKLEEETPGSFLGTFPCPPSTGLTACKLVEDASGRTRTFGCQTTAGGVVTGGSDNDETWGVSGPETDKNRLLAYSEGEGSHPSHYSFGEGVKPKVAGVFRSVIDGLLAKLKVVRVAEPPRDPKSLRW